ncbi:hypothetical protein I6N95_24805 [Vagococcus sp. BWB3-3]|uniref:Uncharacterized protein n=1 Tax=Vagococcus allomyrinae TaxID=2794353 RepID=A0A940SXL3_9ENTE|nr:hypothetical protein [Vagococcus allomyrinae]MBP1044234.1 hypothetical protein [Vagococcus allomyrinae]
MLKVHQVVFNETMILNEGAFLLVNVEPIYDVRECSNQDDQDGEQEKKRIGTKVIVALTGHQLEKIVVTLPDIKLACKSLNELALEEVSFTDFSGMFCKENTHEDYVFKATASHLKFVHSLQEPIKTAE